jgi:hypothetical protein
MEPAGIFSSAEIIPAKSRPARGDVEIGVRIDHKSGAFEQRAMIFPARVADPDLRSGGEAAKEIGADLERAGPADCLHRHDPAFRDEIRIAAEQQRLHFAVVRGNAVDRQIRARRCLVGQLALGALHAVEERHLAVLVAVDADAQVDLGWIRVGIEGLGDAEDGVARRELDRGQKRSGGGCVHGRILATGRPALYPALPSTIRAQEVNVSSSNPRPP